MQATRQVVDLSAIPQPERSGRLRAALDALPDGASFVLAHLEDPRPLLVRLREERGLALEWWPLEEGPAAWRLEVRRRPGTEPGSVAQFLGADHDRLDALMQGVRARAPVDRPDAARLFAEFRAGLLRHIRLEEAVLFPAFDRVTGMAGSGPTAVMRAEHREIEGLLDRMHQALAAPAAAPGEFETLRGALIQVLTAHNEKEEAVVYPMTDRGLPPGTLDALIKKMMEA